MWKSYFVGFHLLLGGLEPIHHDWLNKFTRNDQSSFNGNFQQNNVIQISPKQICFCSTLESRVKSDFLITR